MGAQAGLGRTGLRDVRPRRAGTSATIWSWARPRLRHWNLGSRSGRRGWDVTCVEIAPKALRAARDGAQKAGVEVQFLKGSVAALRDRGAGSGFRLVLDFGTVHGLTPGQVNTVAREVSAVTTDDATLLMYAFSPGRKGPTPRGLSREEVAAAYAAWRVVDEQPCAYPTCPHSSRKANPRRYRLRRVESQRRGRSVIASSWSAGSDFATRRSLGRPRSSARMSTSTSTISSWRCTPSRSAVG